VSAQRLSLYSGEQPEAKSYPVSGAQTLAGVEQPHVEESEGLDDLRELTQTLADLPLPTVSIIGFSGEELEGFSALKKVGHTSVATNVPIVGLVGYSRQQRAGSSVFRRVKLSVLKRMKLIDEPMLSASSSERFNFANPFVGETDAVLDRIDRISAAASDYDEDETPPDPRTKTIARQLILNVPGHLLAGADVFPYFGEVDITWQSGDKRVKLIVPPASTGASPSVYQGQMQQGRVGQPMLKQNATPRDLISSLLWLQS
jgi:hypothetical protein